MRVSRLHMVAERNMVQKYFGAALIAASLMSTPTWAKEGAGAKISVFGNNDMSSPFSEAENREDPMYSPYSPFGNGDKAVYNDRRGTADEVKFWRQKFDECA